MSFENLKKSSATSFKALAEKVNNSEKKSYGDERVWTPKLDKDGNTMCVIRFLPEIEGEDAPFVKLFRHGFKNAAGQWFNENCRTTLGQGQKCAVCESNSKNWNTGSEEGKKIASARGRKSTYYSNILVIDDMHNPENNGKVFLFTYGQKIYNKIKSALDEKINVFDFWTGANFKLKITKVAGFNNYDMSAFSDPKPLFDGDDTKLLALWKTQYPLLPFVSESNFKSELDIDTKFRSLFPDEFNSIPVTSSTVSEAMSSKPTFSNVSSQSSTTDDEDEDLAMYRELLG